MSTTLPEQSHGIDLIGSLLAQQQRLTAVDKFAQWHKEAEAPLLKEQYQDLIPLVAPNDGEQYAFEVDLDACSGCKACVAACHSLNGLEELETWRSVGLLAGGTTDKPVLQHVTTACHHCIDPACHRGCPVEAYEKDDVTGIVRHLDDQCIGCQYCIFKCPYDVPKYSPSKGIVRKCDMCHDRLAVGEAPACVQSCPNKAIKITTVKVDTIAATGEANSFLPGAPDPSYTLPTTTYRTERHLPGNLQPADSFSARPQHAHLPLVFMLVLTQMSVGAFVIQLLMTRQFDWAESQLVHVIAAIVLGFIGMTAALFHLGRPLYAFRAFIGLRTSWLSREILAFSLFPAVTSLHAVGLYFSGTSGRDISGTLAAGVGIAAVFCSAMIYIDTQRPFWNAAFSLGKFFGSCIVLGIPVTMLLVLCDTQLSENASFAGVLNNEISTLSGWLLIATLTKLAIESTIFLSLRHRAHTPLKRSALLLRDELGLTTLQRYFFGVVGGVAIPSLLYMQTNIEQPFSTAFLGVITALAATTLLIGELMERYLYFAAVTPPKMPGVQAS